MAPQCLCTQTLCLAPIETSGDFSAVSAIKYGIFDESINHEMDSWIDLYDTTMKTVQILQTHLCQWSRICIKSLALMTHFPLQMSSKWGFKIYIFLLKTVNTKLMNVKDIRKVTATQPLGLEIFLDCRRTNVRILFNLH